jgi:lipopolysaccharide transport system permease protein
LINFARQILEEWIRWARLGWFDIESRYRRTMFGPLWIVMLTGMTVGTIGFVYGSLFKVPVRDFIPYVAIGLVIWSWISVSLIEAGTSFSAYRLVLLNQKLNPSSIVVRVVLRNWVILMHNGLVIILLFIVFGRTPTMQMLMALPGMIIVGATVFAGATATAFVCTRFRDLQQMLVALMSLGLLITPVIWSPEVLGEDRLYIAYFNPLTHLLDLVRLPLLGLVPRSESWLISFGLMTVLSAAAIFMVRRYRHCVPFWL